MEARRTRSALGSRLLLLLLLLLRQAPPAQAPSLAPAPPPSPGGARHPRRRRPDRSRPPRPHPRRRRRRNDGEAARSHRRGVRRGRPATQGQDRRASIPPPREGQLAGPRVTERRLRQGARPPQAVSSRGGVRLGWTDHRPRPRLGRGGQAPGSSRGAELGQRDGVRDVSSRQGAPEAGNDRRRRQRREGGGGGVFGVRVRVRA